MEGYDQNWQEIENGGIIKYVKIPSGTYQLKLIASNANDVKGAEKILGIHIALPYFGSRDNFCSLLVCFYFSSLTGFIVLLLSENSGNKN